MTKRRKDKRIPLTIEEVAINVHAALLRSERLVCAPGLDENDPRVSALIVTQYLVDHPDAAHRLAQMHVGRFARMPLMGVGDNENGTFAALRHVLESAARGPVGVKVGE